MLLKQIETLNFPILKRILNSFTLGRKSLNFLKWIFLILFFVPAACEKEEELHDIEVKVQLIDENGYSLDDRSGVAITLSRGSETFHGISDDQGKSVFSDLPYGIFNVLLEKEGFISDLIQPEITNHKGDSVWSYDFRMVEIPNYRLRIDSIIIDPAFGKKLLAFGEIYNTKGLPAIQLGMRVFFGDTPDVSKDNYLYYHFGTIMKRLINDGYYEMWITNWYGSLIQGDFDTLYVRVYP
ncbi:MAG: hypothetical protein LC658_15690, partial [Bacteroidales bacterium]|nr:hypothetical protein [Bacteroidales bacterium]